MYSLLWKRLFIAALALATAITSVAADATGKRFQQRLFTDALYIRAFATSLLNAAMAMLLAVSCHRLSHGPWPLA